MRRRTGRECPPHGLVVNFDSIASPLGHLELGRSGAAALGTRALDRLARAGGRRPCWSSRRPTFTDRLARAGSDDFSEDHPLNFHRPPRARRGSTCTKLETAEPSADRLARAGVDVHTAGEVSPFFDTFPLNASGVPSLCFYRSKFSGGRWQHHSRPDVPANVSFGAVLRLVQAVAPLVQDLAGRRAWPFARALPPAQARKVKRLADELFDF